MQTELRRPPEPINPAVDLPIAAPSRSRLYISSAALAAGPLILLLLIWFPALDQMIFHDPLFHLLITSVVSIMGVILALLVLHVARRAWDGRVFLIGMGFLSAASIFITHSISTPNVLMSGRILAIAVSSTVGLWLGSVFFALSGLNLSPTFNKWLMRRAWLGLLAFWAFWLVYNWIFLVVNPTIATAQAALGTTANPLDLLRTPLLIAGLGCYAFAIGRHYTFYRRSPSQAGLGMLCGMAFFGEALLAQYFSRVYALSFWLYHLQEFAGFAVISYAVLGAYRRGLTDESLLESLLLAGTRARLQAGYARAMEALVETLSRGEQPTPPLRDALRARFGLAESQVRVLEQAATAVAQERRQRQELEELNRSLRQLEAHKDQLIQMIIHDLKNPLTALIGFLDILRMDHLTDDQRTLLDNALQSGRNLSDLIGDLLDIGRIEEGRLELEHSLLAPRDLLEECADEMRGWLIQERKTIEIETQADLPLLYADPRLMRRVMLNLLSNAIKHTPLGTHIALRATRQTIPPAAGAQEAKAALHQIVVEVEDNGPGIPSGYIERIFEKFGRFSGEQPARQHSTGLGLTLCRLVVEAHGGTIGVTSVAGQGTTFRVTLPGANHCQGDEKVTK